MKGYLLLVLLVATAVARPDRQKPIKSPRPNPPPLPQRST